MPDQHDHGTRWGSGPPPWVRGGRSDTGRRFRRGVLGVFVVVVVLVAALASIVASLASGTHPKPFITITVAALVVVGLIVTARWLWRSARSIGALMDAADRVAGGNYATRVGDVPGRPYQRLAGAFDEMTIRLQTNEQRRRELLADVAHELRTPLQAIRGATEGMLDGLYPADDEHLRPVLERTDVMARLLDDLRTLSMVEAGVLELHRETVDPRAATADAIGAVHSTVEGVTFDVVDDRAPATIEADPVRLAEILTNLLANAARYTPAGDRIAVTISADDSGGAGFIVDDTGPGIDADQLPHVFDRFVRSADRGGTGLGLAIAKRLVEAHGGTIEAGAAPGGGTRMRFGIPADGGRR
jgi:two-component system sensor histidine kinase BaeS